ncbi:hypothetical protein ES705_29865 [subsurface metagenome]
MRNESRKLIKDLDVLSMPAYDLIQAKKHFGYIRHETIIVNRCLLLLISRCMISN